MAASEYLSPRQFSGLRFPSYPGHDVNSLGRHLMQSSPEAFHHLSLGVRQAGVRTPVVLRGNNVIDGARRIAAAHQLGIRVPVIREKPTDGA